MMTRNFITPKVVHSKSRCFVNGCKFDRFDRSDPDRKSISTFHIPKKREVFEKWVQCCGRTELLDLPIEALRRTLNICELHFATLHGGAVRKRISSETIPTCFPKGHTPLSEEEMTSWRSAEHYKSYWAAHEKKTRPSNNIQRCPNLPPNSTAIYCQSTGPFPCLYCETVQPVRAPDPYLHDLVPNLPSPSVPALALSESSTMNQNLKPPPQEAVGESLFSVVKNYFEHQEIEESKSSQKVVVIKCATPEKSVGESHATDSPGDEDKNLIVVKISSPDSQDTQEPHVLQANSDLLEVLTKCAEVGPSEICEIVSSSHTKPSAAPSKAVTSSQLVQTHKSPSVSKGDKTAKSKAKKPVYYNFQFEQKLVPIPSSFQKLHNLSKSSVDNSHIPLNTKPFERVMAGNSSNNSVKNIEPVKTAEEMATASEIKRRKLL